MTAQLPDRLNLASVFVLATAFRTCDYSPVPDARPFLTLTTLKWPELTST
jgi:hypothetical protein